MNLKNLNKLIAHLERISSPKSRPKVGFNMDTFIGPTGYLEDHSKHNCGTVACIAGHAAILAEGGAEAGRGSVYLIAVQWLDLHYVVAENLFYGQGRAGYPLYDVTLRQAINTLKKLARTGTVDWHARAPRKAAP